MKTIPIHKRLAKMLVDEKTMVSMVSTFSDQTTGVDLSIRRNDNTLFVLCRGSDEFIDWITNFDAHTVSYNNIDVHHGYFRAWAACNEFVYNMAMDEEINTVYFTGHSAGGALAQLLFVFKPKDLIKKTYCVVFASPKPFKSYTNNFIDMYHNPLDIVGYLPFVFKKANKSIPTRPGLYHSIKSYWKTM